MNTYRNRFFLILTFIFLANSTFYAQGEAEAKSTVDSFYKFYRTRNGLVSTHELNLLKGWFTAELTRLFRNEIKREDEFVRKYPNEKPYFGDGFPFQPFEECVIGDRIFSNRLEFGAIKTDANKAIVEVKFYIPKECEDQIEEKLLDIYKIELLKTKSRWLINDWIYNDGKRLTEILKREKY